MTGGICDDDGDARESRLLLQIPKKLEPLAQALWRVAFRAAFPQRPLPRHLPPLSAYSSQLVSRPQQLRPCSFPPPLLLGALALRAASALCGEHPLLGAVALRAASPALLA